METNKPETKNNKLCNIKPGRASSLPKKSGNSNLKIVKTLDESNTLYNCALDEHYHSTYGAISESMHIFINAGLNYRVLHTVKIFEAGFGTGLNTILTYIESLKRNVTIHYTSIELYPVNFDIIKQLNYSKYLPDSTSATFNRIHECSWNKNIKISDHFTLKKLHSDLDGYNFTDQFDIIYFDAFAPEKQPDLWTYEIFNKLYHALNNNGILTTYSSKGIVKNNLRKAGFKVSRLEGPKGKRHMLRASKIV